MGIKQNCDEPLPSCAMNDPRNTKHREEIRGWKLLRAEGSNQGQKAKPAEMLPIPVSPLIITGCTQEIWGVNRPFLNSHFMEIITQGGLSHTQLGGSA